MTVEKELHKLQEIQASDALRHRLNGMVADLPSKHRGFYFPLVAFQGAVVMAVLLLLIGLGSGVVAAAKGSHPGSPLYPVRQAIEKVPFLQPTVMPTKTPVQPTTAPTITPQVHKSSENNGQGSNGKKSFTLTITPEPTKGKKEVKGVSTTSIQQNNNGNYNQSHSNSHVGQFLQSFFHSGSRGNGNNNGNSSSKRQNH